MPRNARSPIVIGMQPHTQGRIKTPRERTKEMMPRRLEAVITALRALHTLGSPTHHDLRPPERKRVLDLIQEELHGVELALEGKSGTLVPKIFEDE